MAKRMTKIESMIIAVIAIVAIPIAVMIQLVESIGWVSIIAISVVTIGSYFWYQNNKKQKRLTYLHKKYQNNDLVQKIFKGYFWQGQNESELIDSLGKPEAIDRKVLKTKTKEIWKYNPQGANRYGLRITVENGKVIGWDKKT